MLTPFGREGARRITRNALARLSPEEKAGLELAFRAEEDEYTDLLVNVIREQLRKELPPTIRRTLKRARGCR